MTSHVLSNILSTSSQLCRMQMHNVQICNIFPIRTRNVGHENSTASKLEHRTHSCVEGNGHNIIDFRIDESRYILVPALHTDPDGYCTKAHGMSLAMVDSFSELARLSDALAYRKKVHGLTKIREIWIGGRTTIVKGEEVTAMRDVYNGKHCVY